MAKESSTNQLHKKRAESRKLLRAFFAKPRIIHVILLLICFMLGVALATQVRAQRQDPLESMGEKDLVALLDHLSNRQQDLRTEKDDLQTKVTQLKNSSNREKAAEEARQKNREQAQINAGVVPIKGRGITVTITESGNRLEAVQFVSILNELRNAGAEGMSLNGLRLGMSSWFSDTNNGIVLEGKLLHSPYRWKVIGAPETLATALEISGGPAQMMRAKNADVTINKSDEVTISDIRTLDPPRWARMDRAQSK